jgi:hypothetical protein
MRGTGRRNLEKDLDDHNAERSRKMIHRTTVAGIGLMIAVAASLSGCAGRVHLSSRLMCEANNGTYNSATKQCAYPPQPPQQSAAQMCQMHGGELDPVTDTCAIDDRSR